MYKSEVGFELLSRPVVACNVSLSADDTEHLYDIADRHSQISVANLSDFRIGVLTVRELANVVTEETKPTVELLLDEEMKSINRNKKFGYVAVDQVSVHQLGQLRHVVRVGLVDSFKDEMIGLRTELVQKINHKLGDDCSIPDRSTMPIALIPIFCNEIDAYRISSDLRQVFDMGSEIFVSPPSVDFDALDDCVE